MDTSAIVRRLHGLRRAFKGDRRANVAVFFALATLPIMGFVGAAVDYSRAAGVRTAMQDAADATALAIAKMSPKPADPTQAAHDYFMGVFNGKLKADGSASTYNGRVANGLTVTASYNAAAATASQVVIGSSATVTSDFLSIMHMPQLSISANSTAKWGVTKLQIALVLDNTGSMADFGKMTALKTATHSLLAQLQNLSTNPDDVKVAIVPFATDVNVGSNATTQAAPWIEWNEWNAANTHQADVQTCKTFTFNGQSFPFCFTQQQAVPNDHSTWNGCIWDRNQDYDVSNATPDPAQPLTLFSAHQSPWCPAPMMGLTNNWTALNSLVDQMTPNGNTNQTIGLVWGWHALSVNAPLNAPAPTPDTQQVIILLTDGLNTANRWSNVATDVDARTAKVCANIKNATNGTSSKIKIYALLVMAGDSSILQNCASPPDANVASYYYALPSSGAIGTAFAQIGVNLTKLRLAR